MDDASNNLPFRSEFGTDTWIGRAGTSAVDNVRRVGEGWTCSKDSWSSWTIWKKISKLTTCFKAPTWRWLLRLDSLLDEVFSWFCSTDWHINSSWSWSADCHINPSWSWSNDCHEVSSWSCFNWSCSIDWCEISAGTSIFGCWWVPLQHMSTGRGVRLHVIIGKTRPSYSWNPKGSTSISPSILQTDYFGRQSN